MLAGTISPSDPLSVESPSAQQAQHTERDAPRLLIDADGQVALDGQLLARTQLAERLRAQITTSQGEGETPLRLTVKADGAVVSGELRGLRAQPSSLGVEQVQLLVHQDQMP
jgi:biopolymer transport protein ExbD